MLGSSFSLSQPRTFDILLVSLSTNSAVMSAAKLPLFLLLVKRLTTFLDPSSLLSVTISEVVLTCVGHTNTEHNGQLQFVHI